MERCTLVTSQGAISDRMMARSPDDYDPGSIGAMYLDHLKHGEKKRI